MRVILSRLALLFALVLAMPAGAATILFDFVGPVEVRNIRIFSRDAANQRFTSRRSETGITATEFSLPRFTPILGTLTGPEVTYRLGAFSPRGVNSVFADPDEDCGAPGNCIEELDILATFTSGIAIEDVSGRRASVVGFGFDLALTSGLRRSGRSSDGVIVDSGFDSGEGATRSFTAGQSSPAIGLGDIDIAAFNTTAVRLDL